MARPKKATTPACSCGGGCCKENPALALFGNPPAGRGVLFGRVTYLEYRHVDDPSGVTRFHEFGRGAQMWALEDGTVQLRDRNPRARVWEDRPAD